MTLAEAGMLLLALDPPRARLASKGGRVDAAAPHRPSRYRASSGQSPDLFRMPVDPDDEYARQVGYADCVRGSIDRRVGEDPPRA